ncbi:MAG: hypothetical protein ACLR8P_19145 [Clostridium fessum]
MSYSRQKEVLEMPNLIEIQKDSYQWFLDEGLKEVFDDISPISGFRRSLESRNSLILHCVKMIVKYNDRRVQRARCDLCSSSEGKGKTLQ